MTKPEFEEENVLTEMMEILGIEEEDKELVSVDYQTEEGVGYYLVSYGRTEYMVFEDYDDAEELAKARVLSDLQNEPELFDQNWLEGLRDSVIQNETFNEYAAQDAVDSDGVAHFLATYDGDEQTTPNGFYAYRIN